MNLPAAVLLLALAPSVAAQTWSLVGRHGECAPLSTLKRKLPDIPAVHTPEAFAAYLDSKKLHYTKRAHAVGQAQMIEFQVPEVGLSILLVPEVMCREMAETPR